MDHTKRVLWLGRELEVPKEHASYGEPTLFIRGILTPTVLKAWFTKLNWHGHRVWLCKECFEPTAANLTSFHASMRTLRDLVGNGTLAVELPFEWVHVEPKSSKPAGPAGRVVEFFRGPRNAPSKLVRVEKFIRFPGLTVKIGKPDGLAFKTTGGYEHVRSPELVETKETIYDGDCTILPCPESGNIGGPGMVIPTWQDRVSVWHGTVHERLRQEEEIRDNEIKARQEEEKKRFDQAVQEEVTRQMSEYAKDCVLSDEMACECRDATIFITTSFVGFHCWPDAPHEVRHLRNLHRHVFHVKVEVHQRPADGNRSIEYLMFKDAVDEFLTEEIVPSMQSDTTLSCEQIALKLGTLIRDTYLGGSPAGTIEVTVSEDGENGSKVTL